MKNKLLFITVFLLFFYGCHEKENSRQTSAQKVKEEILAKQKQKVENWANFDEDLDTKSIAKVDTNLFRREMNKILPPQKNS